MEWISNLIGKFETVSKNISTVDTVIERVAEQNKDVILSLNKDQLLFGRNTDGDLLSPSYLDDPYFKTEKQAQWYAGMKYNLERAHAARIHNPQLFVTKPRNTPNLIVSGAFQGGMLIVIGGNRFEISSTYEDTADIESKYNYKVFGLAEVSHQYFYANYLHEELLRYIYGM